LGSIPLRDRMRRIFYEKMLCELSVDGKEYWVSPLQVG
jgi:hypothetical protein